MKYGSARQSALTSYFEVPLPTRAWSHDMMITEHYALLFESSVHFSPSTMKDGDFFAFDASHKMRVGVSPKHANSSAQVQWFEAGRAYALVHAMNAWEETDSNTGAVEVVLWAPLAEAFDASLEEANDFHMTEMRMNLATGKMTVTPVDSDTRVEFPRVHPRLLGRFARYGYAGVFDRGDALNIVGIAKYDLRAKKLVTVMHLPEGVRCGEPVPVPKHDVDSTNRAGVAGWWDGLRTRVSRRKEAVSDDVYLATFVFDTRTNATEWRLYDGESMAPEPVVRLGTAGKRVPFGFHGEWIPESTLSVHIKKGEEQK